MIGKYKKEEKSILLSSNIFNLEYFHGNYLSRSKENRSIFFKSNRARNGNLLLIVESHVRENDDEWFFPYQSKEYLETMDINKSIIGNWPIFVSKNGGVPSIR